MQCRSNLLISTDTIVIARSEATKQHPTTIVNYVTIVVKKITANMPAGKKGSQRFYAKSA